MMLGEVSPGGVGSGLYGMLVLAVITVFLAGLMVGRTPEYLGKKIGRREMTLRRALRPGDAGRAARGRRAWPSPPRRAWRVCRRRRRTASARCSTPSRRRRNNNGSAFAGLTVGDAVLRRRARAVACSSAGSCRSSWCSPWPARWPRSGRCPRPAGPCPPPAAVRRPAHRRRPGRRRPHLPAALALGPIAEALL